MKPKEFLNDLLIALHTLSGGTANMALPWKQVADQVLAQMGFSVDQFGDMASSGQPSTYRWIQSAFRALRNQDLATSGGNGKWAITEAGVAKVGNQPIVSQVAPAPVTSAEPEIAPTVPTEAAMVEAIQENLAAVGTPVESIAIESEPVIEEAPVEEATVVEAPDEKGRSWDFMIPPAGQAGLEITADPYLLSLQTAQASCYGKFSDRSDLCKVCPIRIGCYEQIKTHLFEISETLKLEERTAQGEGLDDLFNETSDMPAPEPEPEPEPAPEPAPNTDGYDMSKVEEISATLDTACVVCQKAVTKGSDCKWIPGVGVFHLHCI